MSDDSKFDSFLRQHDQRAPTAPVNERRLIRARITVSDESWIQILRDTVRSFDFWIPSVGLSALALIGVMIFTRVDGAPSTTDTVTRITEVYETDLVSSTAYEFKAFD